MADERNLVDSDARDEAVGNDRRPEPVNRRALAVMRRVEAKLLGKSVVHMLFSYLRVLRS